MPTILRSGPYAFSFFSSDRSEPAHVHVQRDRQVAKFWLDEISLARNHGFSDHEIGRIRALIGERRADILRAWHDFFGA